jgi:hypothetical protein
MVMTWLAVGAEISYILGWFLHWRTFALVSGAVTLFFIPFLCFLPSMTPVLLVELGRTEEAKRTICWFNGPNINCELEVEEIKLHLEEAKKRQPSFRYGGRSSNKRRVERLFWKKKAKYVLLQFLKISEV